MQLGCEGASREWKIETVKDAMARNSLNSELPPFHVLYNYGIRKMKKDIISLIVWQQSNWSQIIINRFTHYLFSSCTWWDWAVELIHFFIQSIRIFLYRTDPHGWWFIKLSITITITIHKHISHFSHCLVNSTSTSTSATSIPQSKGRVYVAQWNDGEPGEWIIIENII